MIRVHVNRGVIGLAGVESTDLVPQGQTVGDVLRQCLPPDWRVTSMRLVVAVDGRPVELGELDEVLPDDCDVVVGPDVSEAITIIGFVVYLVLLVGAYYYAKYQAEQALQKLKELGEPQQRNEDTSPTYGWDGISTTYGQGVTIPVVFGEHEVGGHVIFQEVAARSSITPGVETLRVVLALSADRIESIGGQSGGGSGEFNALGGLSSGGPVGAAIPAGITVNGNLYDHTLSVPGIRVWGRLGADTQSPLPAPFAGSSITEVVGESLDTQGSSILHTILDNGSIATIGLIFSFPGGLYYTDPATGLLNATTVSLQLQWRVVGQSAWNQFVDPARGPIIGISVGGSFISTQPYVTTSTLQLLQSGGDVEGPIEVQVTRTTVAGGVGWVDSCIWRQVIWSSPHIYAYPGIALVGLEIEGSERVGGGNPQVRVPVRGRQVRAWDSVNGWSAYTWLAPPAPHNYYVHEIGRNPAWIIVEMALARTAWGLGDQLSVADIDLPAFAEWAIYCDQHPGAWAEARYRFDGVFDSPRPAWEQMQQVAAAGNAILYWIGSKLSVVYRFRDAHSAGPISVPAKARTQVFPSSVIRNLVVRYLPRRTRPTVIDYQFLDRDLNYEPSLLPVEDPDVDPTGTTVTDPEWRREPQQMFGVTRASHLFRQGRLEHRLNSLIAKEVVFEVPHFALGAQLGAIVGVQQDWMRPFATGSFGLTILVGGDAVTEVSLDQEITIPPATTMQLVASNKTGGVDVAQINMAAGTYAAGTPLVLAGPVTAHDGAPVALGVLNAVVEDFEIHDLTLTEDLWRKVRAVQWVTAVYDVPDPSEFDPGSFAPLAGSVGGGDFAQFGAVATDLVVPASDIVVRRSAVHSSRIDIGWIRPEARQGGAARVFVRAAGAVEWSMAAEVAGSSVTVDVGSIGPALEIAVVLESLGGQFPPLTAFASLVVDEFPAVLPYPARDVRVDHHELGVLVSWLRSESPVDYYEVRRGESWDQAATVARTGDASWIDTLPLPLIHGVTYFVAPRRHGQYGLEVNAQDPTDLALVHRPPGTHVLAATRTEVADPPSGTLAGLEYGSDPDEPAIYGFTHVVGVLEGSYETLELVLRDGDSTEITADAYWSVYARTHGRDEETVDDWDQFTAGSGEALWRSVDYREATIGRPGISRRTVDEAFPTGVSIDSLDTYSPDQLAFGRVGEAGERWFADLESRYYASGMWSAWANHRDGRRLASRIQVRALLVRESLDVRVWLTGLFLSAHI